jgi:hypothetical protein
LLPEKLFDSLTNGSHQILSTQGSIFFCKTSALQNHFNLWRHQPLRPGTGHPHYILVAKSYSGSPLTLSPRRPSVWLPEGSASIPVFYRPTLRPGFTFTGPALVGEDFSTTLVLPGFRGRVAPGGCLLLERI